MLEREPFTVQSAPGHLGGWLAGSGPPLLLLHGGPGLGCSYLDELAAELAPEFRVAVFQQRGVPPSTVDGPFTMAQAIGDVVSVLDGLGWERALVAGHSWGGHLAFRVLAACSERLSGALGIDPIGVVGDGGLPAAGAEIMARLPRTARDRAGELDDRAMAGQGTAAEFLEAMRLMWPAYFANPQDVPAMPEIPVSLDAYAHLIAQIPAGTDTVVEQLRRAPVPFGIIAGGASPIPWGQASRATAELAPGTFLEVVPHAGHFIWVEAPGRVRAAARRVSASA